MNKILVICGPTATGKTDLAVKLALEFDGELISADSRQVYQGMDIITGKDQPEEIKIHLIDIVKPDQEFSVSYYCRLAWQAIIKIWRQNKLPILVGGTGFYIKAVINDVGTKDIPPNPRVREGMKGWTASQLYDYLANLDPNKTASMNRSDRFNPRRLIRAIEVAIWAKENQLPKKTIKPTFSILMIGLKTDFPTLYQRIDRRVIKRIRMGAEAEIKKLLAQGYNWENSVLGVTTGYREWRQFFENKASRESVIKKWQFAEHAYARRQMTWFKKNKNIFWFDISDKKWQDKIRKKVSDWHDAKN